MFKVCWAMYSYHLHVYLLLSLVVSKMAECLAKLQAKRLIALCALFTLQCPAYR